MQKKQTALTSILLSLSLMFLMISAPIKGFAEQASETEMSAEQIKNFSVDAKAAFSVDFETGKILYNQNGDTTMGIASITKLISLYLVAEQVKTGKLAWEDTVPVSDYAAALSVAPDLSNVPLHQDVSYTVKDLFDAGFIQSANAAVVALAEKIAGSEAAFVDMMKEKVAAWGISDAKLVNASGLNNSYLGNNIYPNSSAKDENEMSAKDVAIVARHMLQDYPEVLTVTSTANKTFGEGSYSPVEMVNWNWMLPGFLNAKEGVDGLKTGTTDLAGACFVSTAVKNKQRIITVVLNVNGHNEDPSVRFVQTGKLIDYSFGAWKKETAFKANTQLTDYQTIAVKDGKELTVPVSLKEDLTLWVRNDMNLEDAAPTVVFNKNVSDKTIQAPIKKGTSVATVTTALQADTLGYIDTSKNPAATDLVTEQAVEKANIFVIAWRNTTDFFKNLF